MEQSIGTFDVLTATKFCFVAVNLVGRVTYLNPACEALLKVSFLQVVGRKYDEFLHLHPGANISTPPDPIRYVIDTGKVIHLPESTILFVRNNETLVIEGHATPLLRDGVLIGALLSFQEQGLVQKKANHTVSKVQAQLSQKHEELAAANRLLIIGEMTSGIAHELNQPLSAILSYSQASIRLIREKKLDLPKISHAIESVTVQAKRAGEVINKLRAFVKKRKNLLEISDLNSLCKSCVQLCESEILRQGYSVTLKLEADLPSVLVDHIHFEQILINLIKNALEAHEPESSKEIEISTSKSQQQVFVSVRDYGPGLPTEVIDQIFKPFTTTKEKGLGLGLMICQTLAEQMGASLTLQNHASGLGAEAVLRFRAPL